MSTVTLPALRGHGELARPGVRVLIHLFDGLAVRRRLAIAVVGLLAFAGCALLALVHGQALPTVHDEFSYLLAGDTFAHGRWTNPPLPDGVWQPLESIHIIQQPTCASKYPPGQGVFLAVGQWLGHPLLGVWLSLGLACAALCWMLQAWLPARLGLVGALLGTTRLTFGGEIGKWWGLPYWGSSYWGGGVAMLGGCLVLGACRRLLTARPRVLDSVLLGIGIALLANSRPYEGALLCLPVGAVLLVWLCGRDRPPLRALLPCVALPLGLVLGVTGALMGVYNQHVTGDALRLPYQVHAEQYEPVPVFQFQRMRPEPVYRHQEIAAVHAGWAGNEFRELGSLRGYLRSGATKVDHLWGFFLGPLLTLPLLALPWTLHRRWLLFALSVLGLMVLNLTVLSTWSHPHYAAPVTGLIYYVVAECLRRLTAWQVRGVAAGRSALTLLLAVCWLGLPALALTQDRVNGGKVFATERARLLAQIQAGGGRHLVLVRYSSKHPVHQDWVYNRADLASAPVVWARLMGEPYRSRLLAYFSDRRVWLLHAEEVPPRLEPLRTAPQ